MPNLAQQPNEPAEERPSWFNGDGQLAVMPSPPRQQLTLAGENASITIHPADNTDSDTPDAWIILYGAQQENGQDFVYGTIRVTTLELVGAFDLAPQDRDLTVSYTVCRGRDGHFRRRNNFLSIPDLGTECSEGNFNVSIHLTTEIRNAVRALINRGNTPAPLKLVS